MSQKILNVLTGCRRLAGVVALCSLSTLTPIIALADAPSIVAMTQMLRNAKVVSVDRPLRLSIGNKTVLIATERLEKSTDKDCCIDSVLLAKTLIDTYPDEINRVKVMFSKSGGDTYTQVNVTTGDVKAFGSGQISEDQLLSSLDVQDISAASTGSGDTGTNVSNNLVPGPFIEKRLLLLQQIDDLEKKGTGVKPFRDLFDKVEADIKQGDQTTALTDIQYLAQKLGEEQQVLKELSVPRLRTASTARTIQGAASRYPSSMGGRGGNSDIGEPPNSGKLEMRCNQWTAKLQKWKAEGRDVDALLPSMELIRQFSIDPKNYENAQRMLDALDVTLVKAPPTK